MPSIVGNIGDLWLECALLHLMTVYLQALAQVLNLLPSLLVPSYMPLIGVTLFSFVLLMTRFL